MSRGGPCPRVRVSLDEVIARTVKLADAFRGCGWQVVHVKVPNALGIKLLKQGRTLLKRIS
jgi:hypothetical protein